MLVPGKSRCVTIRAFSIAESDIPIVPFPSTEKTRFRIEAFVASPSPATGQDTAAGASMTDDPCTVRMALPLPSIPVAVMLRQRVAVKIGAEVPSAVIPVVTVSIVHMSNAGQVNAVELFTEMPVAQFSISALRTQGRGLFAAVASRFDSISRPYTAYRK